MAAFTCEIDDDPTPESLDVIQTGLDQYDRERAGQIDYEPLTVFGRDAAGELVGGLRATLGGGWLYVQTLWVAPEHRGQGVGAALLRMAEDRAVDCGHPRAFLNTLSYQAVGFYERMGYREFARLEDAPAPHARVFMRRDLQA